MLSGRNSNLVEIYSQSILGFKWVSTNWSSKFKNSNHLTKFEIWRNDFQIKSNLPQTIRPSIKDIVKGLSQNYPPNKEWFIYCSFIQLKADFLCFQPKIDESRTFQNWTRENEPSFQLKMAMNSGVQYLWKWPSTFSRLGLYLSERQNYVTC